MLEVARQFAIDAHGSQQYGDKPYLHHLEAVVALLEPYGETAKVVGYLHDVVEDTEISAQDVANTFGAFVAECVAILSDEPGENRKERKLKTYEKMSKVDGKHELALIVKAADRLANIQACLDEDKTTLYQMYRAEHQAFSQAVYRPGLCEDIWERIRIAFAME